MALAGCVAIVIGGAQGIGRAYCEALLAKGVKVATGDCLEDVGKQSVQELGQQYGQDNIFFQTCDVTSDENIEALFDKAKEKFGDISIVVNNAGIVNEFDWKKCVDVNVGGVVRSTEAAMKHMAKNKGGKGGDLIITCSKSGLRGEWWGPLYSATKHAVLGYVRSWALPKLFDQTNVRVSCICPTTVDTPFLTSSIRPDRMYFAEENAEAVKHIDRIMPSEIGDALIMLLENPDANGQALLVSRATGYHYMTFPDIPDQ